MRILILILLGLMCFSAQAEVYKWVDENGNTHYTDKPKKGAEVVELKAKTQNQITLPPPVILNLNNDKDKTAKSIDYQLTIQSPEQDATIRGNNGEITVVSQITPKLSTSHFLVLFMDGERTSEPQNNGLFKLENVDRGTHQLQVRAIDQNGKVLASSLSKQVYLHRTRIGQSAIRPKNNKAN